MLNNERDAWLPPWHFPPSNYSEKRFSENYQFACLLHNFFLNFQNYHLFQKTKFSLNKAYIHFIILFAFHSKFAIFSRFCKKSSFFKSNFRKYLFSYVFTKYNFYLLSAPSLLQFSYKKVVQVNVNKKQKRPRREGDFPSSLIEIWREIIKLLAMTKRWLEPIRKVPSKY